MTRSRLIVIGVTIAAAAVGLLVGWLMDLETLGAVTGGVIGWPLGVALVTRRRRWLAIALLNAHFVLSYIEGGWFGCVYAIAASALTFFISAAILRQFYGDSEFKALAHQLKVAIGLTRGFQIINDGKTMVPKESASPMGPHFVLIRPDNAVILERGSQRTRISGPAFLQSRPFEYVKRIYDLRQKQESFTLHNVLTSDLMVTTVGISVTYGINISAEARRGQTPLTATEVATIEWIDSRMPNWERETKAAIEGGVRLAVSAYSLEHLLTHTTFAVLERQILREINRRTRNWGIRVQEVVVKSVLPGQEVTTARTSRWLADLEEQARATAWSSALQVLANGYKVAKGLGMSEEQIHREVLRRTLEHIGKDPASKVIITPELDSALAGLRRSTGLSP